MAEAFSKHGYDTKLIAFRSHLRFKSFIWSETKRFYGLTSEKIKTSFIYWPFRRLLDPTIGIYFFLLYCFKKRDGVLIYTRAKFVALFATILGYQIVYESHAPPQNRLYFIIESYILKKEKVRFVLISGELKKIYSGLNFDISKLFVAHSAGRPRKSLKMLFQGRCLNVGYIGSLYEGRGFQIIFDLAERLSNKIFHVIGDYSSINIQSDVLPKNIILYGKLTPDQSEKITSIFDVLLMPYQKKVFLQNQLETSKWMSPMKLFEYLHSSVPIISSDITVLKEILVDGSNSILVNPDNILDWENAIVQLDDFRLREKIAKNARKLARDKYTWSKRVLSIVDFLEDSYGL